MKEEQKAYYREHRSGGAMEGTDIMSQGKEEREREAE